MGIPEHQTEAAGGLSAVDRSVGLPEKFRAYVNDNGDWMAGLLPGDVLAAANEIERLRAAMLTGASILERDGDEWGVGAALRRAMVPNVEAQGRQPAKPDGVPLERSVRLRAGRGVEMPVVERHGDMGRGVKLRLNTDGDGDVLVICDGLDQMTGKPASVAVEFCRPGFGGGRSPKTFDALRSLMFAMQAENDTNPFDPLVPNVELRGAEPIGVAKQLRADADRYKAALERIALAIYGDTAAQVIAGEALKTQNASLTGAREPAGKDQTPPAGRPG